MKTTMKNPLLIASAALLFVAAGTLFGAKGRPAAKEGATSGEHTVTTLKGKAIVVKAEGRVFRADVADGEYKLTNGGAIRVKGGKVVWDAFGAVERLKKGQWRGYADPTG